MVQSMTGFGTVEGEVGTRRARIEIRSVNHRFFHTTLRVPSELAAAESSLRESLRRAFDRGHISVSVRWVEDGAPAMVLDLVRAGDVVDSLRELQKQFQLGGEVTVDTVVRLSWASPGESRESGAAVPWSDLEPTLVRAIAACTADRQREGRALQAELVARLSDLRTAASEVARLAPARLDRELERISRTVATLAAGVAVDPDRLAQEIAIIADRIDVTEELVRLDSHLHAATAALEAGGPVGKQLGFIAQEMGREVNTIGSKANDSEMGAHVVAMKGQLEKVREQLENLE